MTVKAGLASLAAIWLVAVIAPGPNFLAATHMAASRGRCTGLATAGSVWAAVVVGATLWALAGLFGLKALFTGLPAAALAIILAGAASLIWMALALWRDANRTAAEPLGLTRHASLVGCVTNPSNPKTAAFAAALFALALLLGAGLATLGAVCALSAAWCLPASWLGSLAPVTHAYGRARTGLKRITGDVFEGYGVKLALER